MEPMDIDGDGADEQPENVDEAKMILGDTTSEEEEGTKKPAVSLKGDTIPVTMFSLTDALSMAASGARSGHVEAALQLARAVVTRGRLVARKDGAEAATTATTTVFDCLETEVFANLPPTTKAGTNHMDPFAHGDPRQAYNGALHFHRAGAGEHSYKGGTYKGLDIAVGGGGECCVGILIRTVQRADTGAVLEGPSLVVDALLDSVGAESIVSFVTKTLPKYGAIADAGNLMLAPNVPSAVAPSAPIRLEFLPEGACHDGDVISAARTGLGLKKSSSVEDPQFDYILRPYRFVRRPHLVNKSRLWSICSLLIGGQHSTKQIAQLVGTKESMVTKYAADIDMGRTISVAAGQQMARQPFVGKATNRSQTCSLFGILSDHTKRTSSIITSNGPAKAPPTKITPSFIDEDSEVTLELIANAKQAKTISGEQKIPAAAKGQPAPVYDSEDDTCYVPSKKKQKTDEKPAAKIGPDTTGSVAELAELEDPLQIKCLFEGQHGHAWAKPMMEALNNAPSANIFIGFQRDKSILPVRELTFQALKPNPPVDWRVISFGQSPYPRIESATGVAHFDNQIDTWESKAFGKAASMRCMIKAAAIHKYGIPVTTPIATLRTKLTGEWSTVTPPQWFEAMLTQGVLLLNAALSLGGEGHTKDKHVKFWKPVVTRIIQEILQAKAALPVDDERRGVVMLWWGKDSLKVKKDLMPVFAEYSDVLKIDHLQHANPAAQGELFCKKDHFSEVNHVLTKRGESPIDWLPNKDWLEKNAVSEHAAFISETQDLHQLYLERLQDGLQQLQEERPPIEGILSLNRLPLPEAVRPLGASFPSIASTALVTVSNMGDETMSLDAHEKGAIYMYTGNNVYARLNAALRNPNRSHVEPFRNYLRLFLESYSKLHADTCSKLKNDHSMMLLYRGIRKDLAKEYPVGSTVTWWSVSSCTPNLNVAKQFGGGSSNGTLFTIQSYTSVPIMQLSAYQGEEEYILSPGTQLKVLSVTKSDVGASVIALDEVVGSTLVR